MTVYCHDNATEVFFSATRSVAEKCAPAVWLRCV